MKTAIINGILLTPFRCLENGGIIVEDGKIQQIFEGKTPVSVDRSIDAKGAYVSPGFIDIHIHEDSPDVP